ncbi:MAG: GtrA family protein [Xanthomonadales bacterium]|nr:GtrA family protein [Xanthomonadales bacterium]
MSRQPAGNTVLPGARRFSRFVVTGLVNTVASYLVYLLLLPVAGYNLAYVIAFLAGLSVSYLLNLRWVFRVPASWARTLRFPLVYLPQLLLGLAINYGLIEALGVDPRLSLLFVIAITVPLNYLIARWVLAPGQVADHAAD